MSTSFGKSPNMKVHENPSHRCSALPWG